MQHIMSKEEINEAFTDFMKKNGIDTEGKHIGITLAPGGASATVEISATPIKQKRAPRKATAAKPVDTPEPEEVEDPETSSDNPEPEAEPETSTDDTEVDLDKGDDSDPEDTPVEDADDDLFGDGE